jgi:hypothetical protein
VNVDQLLEAKNYSEPDSKDFMRIRDILTKSRYGSRGVPLGRGEQKNKAKELAQRMANAITDPNKAHRRYRAAEEEGCLDLAIIFYKQYRDLQANPPAKRVMPPRVKPQPTNGTGFGMGESLVERLLRLSEDEPTSEGPNHREAGKAIDSLMKLVDAYDGYASEHGVQNSDRFWGNMEEINHKVNGILGSQEEGIPSKINTTMDVINNWAQLKEVAKALVDGAEGYLASRGNDGRYCKNMGSVVRSVKTAFSR